MTDFDPKPEIAKVESEFAVRFAGVTLPLSERHCDGCTLCCNVLRVEEIEKPQWQWCPQCSPGVGCNIYETRPSQCRVYLCGYRSVKEMSEAWHPKKSHMVINFSGNGYNADIYVDPDYPEAWRGEPFYGDLKEASIHLEPYAPRIAVHVGRTLTVILPDRDLEFAEIAGDEEVIVFRVTHNEGQPARNYAYKQKKFGQNPGPPEWR